MGATKKAFAYTGSIHVRKQLTCFEIGSGRLTLISCLSLFGPLKTCLFPCHAVKSWASMGISLQCRGVEKFFCPRRAPSA